MPRNGYFLPIVAVLGFAFLYAPIISLIVYSFNESQLVTVWSGFSTKWYGKLLQDAQILRAAWLSLKIAFTSATLALCLGTLAALVLTRFGKFRMQVPAWRHGDSADCHARGHHWFVAAPPIHRNGEPFRLAKGAWHYYAYSRTYDILHGLCGRGGSVAACKYGRVIGGGGARSWRDSIAGLHRRHTAGDIARASSGWLLAFTLSVDDLVISSFVSGPGSTTLPMVIFSKVRLGVSPEVNALATIIISIVALAVVVGGWRAFSVEKKRKAFGA